MFHSWEDDFLLFDVPDAAVKLLKVLKANHITVGAEEQAKLDEALKLAGFRVRYQTKTP
tara:strand:+ start:967 stop:1143 length:177 start_codon:yes stop_codon:yes gene_type:complete